MKFLRIGIKGKEKPAVLDKDGKIRDLSSEQEYSVGLKLMLYQFKN